MFALLALLPFLSPPTPTFPGQCDALTMERGNWKRIRKGSNTRETERIIRTVALEMGVNPDIPLAIARHESGMSPAALHVLPEDRKAGKAAWLAATYSEERLARYQGIVNRGASDPRFYPAKASILRMQRYQENTYWSVMTQVGETQENVWTWGYGLYGMAPVLYTAIWDAKSPPWVLCDPVVATVTLVWALRAQQKQCGLQTVGESVARFGSGKCDRPLRKDWKKLLPNPNLPTRLGSRWPKETTDRASILQAMKQRLDDVYPPS